MGSNGMLALVCALLVAPQDAPNSGPQDGSRFGDSVEVIADLDGDGAPEFVVGAPYQRVGDRCGVVLVFSGATREVVRTITGRTKLPFGSAIQEYDDLDGDGVRDLLVANDGAATWQVVSPVDGCFLRSIEGPQDAFCTPYLAHWPVVQVGDRNGDGTTDLAGGTVDGVVWFCGRTGAALFSFCVGHAHKVLGVIPDQDGDRLPEVLVGRLVERSHRPTSMEIHASRSRERMLVIEEQPYAVHVGRLASDGPPVVLSVQAGQGKCSATLRDVADGGVILPVSHEGIGLSSCRLVPDLDGDGIAEIVTGTEMGLLGAVTVSSGRTGELVWRREFDLGDDDFILIGTNLTTLPDQNGDGAPEILTGGCDSEFHGIINRQGALWILSGADGEVLWKRTVNEVLGA